MYFRLPYLPVILFRSQIDYIVYTHFLLSANFAFFKRMTWKMLYVDFRDQQNNQKFM